MNNYKKQISDALARIPDLSSNSTTKYNEVGNIIAEAFNLTPDEIYVVTISKAANANVRLQQIQVQFRTQSNKRPKVVIGVCLKNDESSITYTNSANDVINEYGIQGVFYIWKDASGNYLPKKCYINEESQLKKLASDIWPGLKQINVKIHNSKTSYESVSTKIRITNKQLPLNQILYGPPGTGKTHNAINHALSIVTGKDLNELIDSQKANKANRKAAKDEFDELVREGQIQLVTFHQSYSYEEFVEGIKPSVNGINVEYNIEDGIFKKLCLKANDRKSIKDFDSIFSTFTSDVIESGNQLELTTLIRNKPFSVKINSNGSCVAIPQTSAATEMTITKKVILNFMESGILEDWKPYTTAIAKHITDHYKPKTEEKDNSNKNYVLIIDEINRGNISKIFGELITLIEDTKRIGANEELRTKLTYSGAAGDEMFGVPKNIYIVGTMNSADRSIALIDTALRRRFTFFEYTADSTLLSEDVDGINLQNLLQVMNSRIEFLLDKDHLLGHSYFLDIKTKNDLCAVFRNKILPLLEEYFFGNYEKIQQVLGDNNIWKKAEEQKIVQEKKANTAKALFGDTEDFDDKIIYEVNPNLVKENYKDIPIEMFTFIYKSISNRN